MKEVACASSVLCVQFIAGQIKTFLIS